MTSERALTVAALVLEASVLAARLLIEGNLWLDDVTAFEAGTLENC